MQFVLDCFVAISWYLVAEDNDYAIVMQPTRES